MVNCEKPLIVQQNVIYAPDIMFNLISVSKVLKTNYLIIVTNDTHPRRRVLKLFHKGSIQTRMVVVETPDFLHEALFWVVVR